MNAILSCERLSLGYQARVLFREISFAVPECGVFGLMGPSGVGKSTLLRTLGRFNHLLPNFWVRGRACWQGRDLLTEVPVEAARRGLPLLQQKARLYTATVLDNAIAEIRDERPLFAAERLEMARSVLEPVGLWDELRPHLAEPVLALSLGQQRRLSIARLVAPGVSCLLADEPLRDLPAEEAIAVGRMLRALGERLSVVMVTHNLREARELCDHVCLVAAEQVVESAPVEEFFERPGCEAAQQFVRTGNCWPTRVVGPARPARPAWRPPRRVRAIRPQSFHWILPERLGGMQQPGLLQDEDQDLEGLRDLGCRVLVTLTEERLAAEPKLARLGIESVHFPIPDMGVPTVEAAIELCARIDAWLAAGMPTVLHCRAGLGRTGTLLACQLVFRGENPVRAVDHVRRVNSYYIQSGEQLAFVTEVGGALAARRGAP